MSLNTILTKSRNVLSVLLLLALMALTGLTSAVEAQPLAAPKAPGNAEEQVSSSPEIKAEANREWTREELLSAIPYPVKTVGREPKKGDSIPTTTGAFTSADGGLPQDYKGKKEADPVARKGDVSAAYASGTLDPYYYTHYPFRTIGKVFFIDNGVRYVCSASVAVNNAVWTAGHCVFNPSRRTWHNNWVFVPAYADGRAPYGQWYARELWALNGWINSGSFAYDIGMAVLYQNSGSSIANRVGWLGYRANVSRSQVYTAFGYPAASPFNGQRMAWCQDSLRRVDFAFSPATNGIGCNMTGGSSGGPWLINYAYNSTNGNYVNGVNSYKYNNDPYSIYSPYFGDGAINLYNTVRYR